MNPTNPEVLLGNKPLGLTTDTPDTSPEWDGSADPPKWHDIYTEAELVTALRHHAAQLASKYGAYQVSAELSFAADCLDDMAKPLAGSERHRLLDRIDDLEQRLGIDRSARGCIDRRNLYAARRALFPRPRTRTVRGAVEAEQSGHRHRRRRTAGPNQ